MTFIRIRPEPGTSTWVPHNQRVQQRVFSPQEYAAMGYNLRDDYNLTFGSADDPLPTTSEFLVYRADSKKEFVRVSAFLVVDVAIAMGTGGASVAGRVLRSGWPLVKTFLTVD